MWERWKESATGVKTEPLPQTPVAPAPAPTRPAATAPARTAEPARPTTVVSGNSGTTIGKTMVIKGEITSKEDIRIEGTFEGPLSVESHRLVLGPQGSLKSDIKAREVIVEGKVRGNVDASDKIAIGKAGELIGDIRTAGITIEDGGYFRGSVDIVRKPKDQPAVAATE